MADCDTYAILKPKDYHDGVGAGYSMNAGFGIAILIVLIVEVLFFLWVFYTKPSFFMIHDANGNPTDVYNWAAILVTAIVLLFFICLICWLVRASR